VKGLGFPRDIGRYLPGLVFPLFGLAHLDPGEPFVPTGLALRPDTPYAFPDGRVAKYLHPASQPNVLDVHPAMRALLADVDAPLLITEGAIKADAAASVGLVTVALAGVDGWMRSGAPLQEWELVPLKGRQTLICFDSDVTTKKSVRGALGRLVAYMRQRGASVEVVQFPPGPAGQKTGLDDFLAARRGALHPVGVLLEFAVEPEQVPDENEQQRPPELPADVTGADVLDGLCTLLERYIRFPRQEQVWAAALWIAMTHTVDAFELIGYLAVNSATLRSGKTHLLDLIRWTCAHGRRMSGASDAAIFRTLAGTPKPTLVFDEVDNYIGESTERAFLIGVFNEGFERDGVVARVEERGSAREVVDFNVYGAKAFTGIGSILPATTLDRCIRIMLMRRLRSERIAKWRARRVREQADGVRELLAGWAAAAADAIADAYDSDLVFPAGMNERAEDVWEPLLAVAVAAGGDWPDRARQAALELTPADDDSGDLAVLLLADIRRVFADAGWPEAVKSGALVKALNGLEEAPWGALRDGKGLSTHRLARDLAAFELGPERDQLEGSTVRGWWRRSLEPVWERYLPDFEESAEDVKNGESALSAFQSVGASGSADFSLNHAESSSDTLESENVPPEQSVGADNGLVEPKTGQLRHSDTLKRENGGNAESTGSAVVVEHLAAAAEGLTATIEIGRGGLLEVHRLPPGTTADDRGPLQSFLANAADQHKVLAVDCETTGNDPYAPDFAARIWSISDGQQAWAIDARDSDSVRRLAVELARYPGPLAVHNVAFDVPVIVRQFGLDVDLFTGRARSGGLIDTMILARLCRPDERRVGLKEIAKLEFGAGASAAEERLKVAFKHLPGAAETKWRSIDPAHPAYWQYAAVDAALTARLHARLRPDVDDELLRKEMRVAMICLRAGLRGWPVDPDAAAQLEQDLTAERDRLEQTLRSFGIQTIATTAGRAAITEALRREGHNPEGKGLAKETLEPLALSGSQVARDVLALRTTLKFLSVYVPMFVVAADRDGRLHAFPLTLATVTGRMSLPGVPLQTAPKSELALAAENGTLTAAIRSALVADVGNVTASVDFQTMELRIAAALSEDARLRAVVEAGDAHTAVARRLFDTKTPSAKQRAIAKTTNFGILYGMGAEGLAHRLRIAEDQARAFVSRWSNSFPAVRKLRDRLAGEERRSLWGRLLPHDDVPDHIALNHVIQGYGRDVFAAGLLALEDAGLDKHLLLPLHDEYVLQLPADSAEALAAEISSLVRSELNGVELPVGSTIGSRSWASITETNR
jgi:DNA polymerase I-like protein with 3'-5' exonuclease and polymerase domains